MSVDTFYKFCLLIHLICVDCHQEETFHFWGGYLFHREGDLILADVDLVNFSHQICSGCKNFIFIDFNKKIYPPTIIRRMHNGLCTMNVQIKIMLPKNHEISSSVSGEIILEKMKNLIFFVLTLILMDFYLLVFAFGI